MADSDLKKKVRRRLAGLKEARQAYEEDAKTIASLAMPARSRFLASNANKNKRQTNKRLNNSHGIFAFRTMQGGMTSGLSSPSRPWFTIGLEDDHLNEDPSVREWCGEVEKRMYAFLARTNFYSAVKTGYLELGAFGTEACVMLEHPVEGAVCHQLTFGEYWIGVGSDLKPNCLYRECQLTADQAVDMFGRDKVSSRITAAYDRGTLDETFLFFHAIEKNDEQEEGRLDWRGKPWRSVYWEDANGAPEFAQKKGFEEQPFWAPRWDTTGGDFWGQGPGHDALPDLRELQLQTKRKAEATDMLVWPEMVAVGKTKLKRMPKAVTNVAEADVPGSKSVFAAYEVPYQAIAAIGEDVQRCETAIDRATYADLFMAITNMAGIQPRNIEEIASRNEEKLTQLGPVIERVNNEKLEVALNRTFGIMQRGRLLPEPPDAIAHGAPLKITYISILTQMQRIIGLGPMERTVNFVGTMAGMFPEVRHKVDVFELIDEYAERAGCPAKIIRPTDEAEERAGAEAQQAQQAAMVEQAATAAPAARDAVDAARLASELPGNGMSGPEALLPALPL